MCIRDRGKTLVIVESPSKAKTIGKYLGSSYKVIASVGHIRDLPKSKLGIDIENDFEPNYIPIRGKGDLIKELKKEARLLRKSILQLTRTAKEKQFHGIWHICSESTQIRRAESCSMKLQKTQSRMR